MTTGCNTVQNYSNMKIMILSICLLFASLILQAQIVLPDGTTSAGHTATVTAVPSAYPLAMPVNYVRTWTLRKPLSDASLITGSLPVADALMETRYFDGLGRLIQGVTKAASPSGKDMVTPVLYDGFDRESLNYLPYSSTGTDGSFKTNAFNEQAIFMQAQYSNQGELFFYAKNNYEASPLNRTSKMLAPGNSWVGSGKGISISYEINSDNEVRLWNIDPPAGSYPFSDSYYEAGQLYRTVTTDENEKRSVEYKDKEGQVILKKLELTDNADINGHAGWLCTYYVYDELNRLRYVLSPKATDAVIGTGSVPADVAKELCFRYEYDYRNRLITKKVPGAAEVWMIYDGKDRPVFTQDGNLRTKNQWLATIYDRLNRPVLTSMMVYTGSRNDLATYAAHPLHEAGTSAVPIQQSVGLSANLIIPSRQQGKGLYQATSTIDFIPEFISEPGADFIAEIVNGQASSSNLIVEGSPIPTTGVGSFIALTQTFYDDYSHTQKTYDNTDNSKLDPGGNPYAEQMPVTASTATLGMTTSSKVWVMRDPLDLSNGQWLENASFYDNKAKVLQIQSDNEKGGLETTTTRYDFSGKLLNAYQVHQNPQSTAGKIRVLNVMEYDIQNRLLAIKKKINDGNVFKTILQNEYNELGQLKAKHLGAGLQDLSYEYNIRGWLISMNKDYVNNSSGPGRFGQTLSYDYGFSKPQYSGNISGVKWRSAGDGEARAYGFVYDNANRLLKADFTQNNGGWNTTAHVDYSIKVGDGVNSASAYDQNGNIKRMQQWGLSLNASSQVDDLSYNYADHSNKLISVTDAVTLPQNLGDFTDKNATGNDYGYDINGNMVSDLNKRINGATGMDVTTGGGIIYNYLNLPVLVNVKSDDGIDKGSIQYVYDAAGIKHQKITTEAGVSVPYQSGSIISDLITTTTYIGNFMYESKTYTNELLTSLNTTEELQLFSHEEGRLRPQKNPGTNLISGFVYDYFIKDYLGDVRMVLTEEERMDMYEQLTFEDQNIDQQNNLWENSQGNSINVSSVRSSVARNSGQTYAMLVRKSASSIGAAKLLKVMSGDKIHAKVDYFYSSTSANNSATDPLTNIVNSLLSSIANSSAPSALVHGNGASIGAQLTNSSDLNDAVHTAANVNPADGSQQAPKAYLCIMLFNEQLQFDKDNSRVIPVDYSPNSWGTIDRFFSNSITVGKNGYAYVYFTNESDELVYLDNFSLSHERGPTLQETHYYPFGLTMAGISSNAAGVLNNKLKYNGKEEQRREFSDGSGFECMDYGARMYDNQLGRWLHIDPLCEASRKWSPYNYAFDNPIRFTDPDGMLTYDWERQEYINDDKKVVDKDDAMAQMKAAATTVYKANDKDEPGDGDDGGKKKGGTQPKTDNSVNREKYNTIINVAAKSLGAASVATDMTINGMQTIQQYVQGLTRTTYEIINLGEYKLIKGFTVDALGRRVAIVGVLLSAADMINNKPNWSNGTDLAMGGVAFIPGVGWALAAVYFLANPIVQHYTGKSIGEHLGDAVNETKGTFSSMWDNLVNGASHLESSLKRGWAF